MADPDADESGDAERQRQKTDEADRQTDCFYEFQMTHTHTQPVKEGGEIGIMLKEEGQQKTEGASLSLSPSVSLCFCTVQCVVSWTSGTRMPAVWILSVSALVCQMSIAAALHWRRALYPSAFRVKRGTPALINPSFQKSVEDASLLYEVLLSGAYMDAARGMLHVSDRELASMRKLQVLEVVCEDVLPRSLSEIRRVGAQLERWRGTLRMEDFERTVLTLVFTAQQLQHTEPGHQRELWTDTLLQLYRALRDDLANH